MAEQPRPDDLAQLRALVMHQQADLAAQRAVTDAQHARIAQLERRRRFPLRLLPLALTALLVALLPLSILAADPFFSDLPAAAAVHRPNIQAIGNVGITTGFEDPNDPTARLYNPKGLVTREEMASFLARTAGLGTTPPVANAQTAITAQTAASAQTAQMADNALALGGRGADGLVRVAHGQSDFDAFAPLPTAFYVPEGTNYPTFVPMPGAAVAIRAPGNGFVLVSVDVVLFQSVGTRAHIRLRDTTPGADPAAISRVAFEQDNFDQAVDQLSLTWIFPVTGAGTKTFTLEVAKGNQVGNIVYFYNDVLTALYVPFGYDGGTSLGPTP